MQYLDIPGIPGESTHDQNPDWNNKIQISHFSYDVSQRANLGTGTGLVAAGASMSHITFSKTMDKSTPFLWSKLCSGEPIPKVTFRISQAGGQEGVYEIHTLECEQVLVTNYSTSGARGDGGMPSENWSFSVAKVNEIYDDRVQGVRKQKVNYGFDFAQGVGV